MDSAVWGLIGTLIGAAASVMTTYLTNRSAARLQLQARAIERAEGAKSFQRETLLDLQDAFHNAIRLASVVHLEDLKAHANGESWGENMLPGSLSEEFRLANRRVLLLVERVADDGVRKTIKGVMTEANKVAFSSSRLDAEALYQQVTTSSYRAIETIGITLRSLY